MAIERVEKKRRRLADFIRSANARQHKQQENEAKKWVGPELQLRSLTSNALPALDSDKEALEADTVVKDAASEEEVSETEPENVQNNSSSSSRNGSESEYESE